MVATPHLVKNFRVEAIQTPLAMSNPFSGVNMNFIESLLRVIPSLSSSRALEAFHACSELDSEGLMDTFVERCTNQGYQPSVHAEVLLM
nr:hypothetical protein [Nostoc sp. EkiNYC01]